MIANTPAAAGRRWRLGSGWMVVAALFFAVMGALVKKSAQDFGFGFYELVFWRTVFAVVCLGAWAAAGGRRFATPHWRMHISRGVAGTLGLILFFYALARLPLATATTLSYTSALFLALLSWWLLKERVSKRMLLVLLIGFAGIVLLLRPTFAHGQQWAGLLGLGAGLCAGWAYLQVRELGLAGEPGWRVVFYFSLLATLISALMASLTGWQALSSDSAPYVLGIGLTATVAQLCLTRAYQVGRKLVVAGLSYLTVVFSTLLGVWWLGDAIHWQELVGMGMIVVSGIWGAASRR